MSIDFDKLVNAPSFRHFSRAATYTPGSDNPGFSAGAFTIAVVPFLDDFTSGGDGTVGQTDFEATVDIRRSDLPSPVEVTVDDDDYVAGDGLSFEGRVYRVVSLQEFDEGIIRLFLKLAA